MNQRWPKIARNCFLTTLVATCLGGYKPIAVAAEGDTPACAHPVTVEGHFDPRAPDLHVLVKAEFDPSATAHMLAQKYHFTIRLIWTHAARGFAIKDIDQALIPLLQCEPSIEIMSFDLVMTIAHDF